MEQSNENENIISTKNETCENFLNDVPMGKKFKNYLSLESKNKGVVIITHTIKCNAYLVFSCFKVLI
jgi:hypothetical protein